MDGNNRWSKINNIKSYDSYKLGAKKLLNLSYFIFNNYKTINYISAFALSTHNMKRTKSILKIIYEVFEYFLDKFPDNKYNYKLKFIGNLNIFSKKIRDKISSIEKINSNSKKKLIIFINYSGTSDIINAHKKYIESNTKTIFKIEDFIMTKGLPNPDILIRSGGFQRLSDYMIFNLTFTELFFSSKLWPDLKTNDIKKFINKYKTIERKFGI
tara:strand:+ start:3033 stop:3671 length:639 start_codon:yes stop_codon:yes gene_type:complete